MGILIFDRMTLLRGAVFGDFDYEVVGESSIGIILYLFMKLFFSTLLLVTRIFQEFSLIL
jgi:hypothetical protein